MKKGRGRACAHCTKRLGAGDGGFLTQRRRDAEYAEREGAPSCAAGASLAILPYASISACAHCTKWLGVGRKGLSHAEVPRGRGRRESYSHIWWGLHRGQAPYISDEDFESMCAR